MADGRITGAFLFAVFVAAFGSGAQYGYAIASVNGPQKVISYWIGNSSFNDTSHEEAEKKVTFVYSIIVSIFCVGGLVGGLMTTSVLNIVGLKGGILFNNLFVFIASGLMSSAEMAGTYIMLILGRFFVGVNAGLGAGLTPMYLAEISPNSARGAIGSAYQLCITISILLAQIITLQFILGNENWPMIFTVTAGIAVFQVLLFPLCAESPPFLVSKGKTDEARKALVWLRGTQDVDDELQDISDEKDAADADGVVGYMDLFRKPQYRKPLTIALMIMVAQQFSGINAIMFYSTSTFEAAKLSDVAEYGTLAIGAVNVTMTVVAVFLVDKLGRKALMTISFAAMAVDTLCFFASFLIAVQMEVQAASYACIVFLVLFVIFFATGAGAIPWLLISELFRQNVRPKAAMLAVTTHWICNFTVGMTFPIIQNAIGPYVFLIFVVLQVLFLIYIIVAVPETKGKSIDEISAQFK